MVDDLGKHLELLIRIDERTAQNTDDLGEVRGAMKEMNGSVKTHSERIAKLEGSSWWTKQLLRGVGGISILAGAKAWFFK